MKKYNKIIEEAKKLALADKLEEAAKKYEEAFQEGFYLRDYMMLGYIYIDLEKYIQAEDVFTRSILIEEDMEACYGLAKVYEKTGRIEKAIEMYLKSIEKSETFVDPYFSLAYIYDEASEDCNKFEDEAVQKAIEYYEKTIEIDNKYFWAYLNLGSIYERFDYDTKALENFLKAYEINPKASMVCYNLGVAFSKLGSYKKAESCYLREIECENPFSDVYYNLGLLYKDSFNDLNKAKQYYLIGLEKDEANYNIWYNLGCVHALLKDYENAYQCFTYLYYKKPAYLSYLEKDEELVEFRGTKYYQELLNLQNKL